MMILQRFVVPRGGGDDTDGNESGSVSQKLSFEYNSNIYVFIVVT